MLQEAEDYVSFETAKLLKEKGFDEEVTSFYLPNGTLSHGNTYAYCKMSMSSNPDFILAPTHQMAMKWLREVHNVAIVVTPSMFWGRYNISIYKKGNDYPYGFDGGDLVPSYEQACENAIKYCLKTLI